MTSARRCRGLVQIAIAMTIPTLGFSAAHRFLAMELLDPVPSLLNGNSVATDPAVLSQGGTPIRGIAADAASVAVIRIRTRGLPGSAPEIQVGASLVLTVFSDSGRGGLAAEDGSLSLVSDMNGASQSLSLVVPVVATPQGPMAFALYHPPQSFTRGPADEGKATRKLSIEVRLQPPYPPGVPPGDEAERFNINVPLPPVELIRGVWADRLPVR